MTEEKREICALEPQPKDCGVDGCQFTETGHCAQHEVEVERRVNTAKEMKGLKEDIKDANKKVEDFAQDIHEKVNTMKDTLVQDIAAVKEDIAEKDKALSNKQNWILATITVSAGVYLLITTGSFLYTTITTSINREDIKVISVGMDKLANTVIRTEERLATTNRAVGETNAAVKATSKTVASLARLQAEHNAKAALYVEDWQALKKAMDVHERAELRRRLRNEKSSINE